MKCCLFRSKWYWYHVPTVCFWKEVVLFHKVHIHLRLRLSGWRWNTLAIYFYIQRFSHKWTTHLVSFIINSYWHLISAISFLSTPNLQKYGSRSESSLTREILVFTLYTKRLKILKSHVLSTERIYVLYGSQNKCDYFSTQYLRFCYYNPRRNVYCTVRTVSLNAIQGHLCF